MARLEDKRSVPERSEAVIAAGVVVTRNVPENAVVAGIPEKTIKYINEVAQ